MGYLPKKPPRPTPVIKSDKRYHSTQWRRARAVHLSQEPLCRTCLRAERTTPATVVDHIIPVRQGADFWDNTNYQSLCATCHNAKRQREKFTTRY